ncbi:MAG: LysE family translocator [Acetobacteraceae bacterium]|nr:LysE family translocator [Acetobacteraceae bacterium]
MTPELWVAYLTATAVLLAIPGPTVTLVVSYALAEGRRSALGTVAGVALGDLTAMSLSLAGLGAVLSTSAALFTALKWAGACYLVYLGVRMWRAPPSPPALGDGSTPAAATAATRPRRSGLAMMGHAFAVTALNPKGIVFFVAFLPQFIRPTAPVVPQMLLLGGTFLVLATANAAAYALLAGGLRRAAVRSPRVLRAVNRVGGALLIGAGVMTAALRRAP